MAFPLGFSQAATGVGLNVRLPMAGDGGFPGVSDALSSIVKGEQVAASEDGDWFEENSF